MTTSGGLEVGLSPSTLEIFASHPLLGPRTKDEREDQGREKIKFGLRAREKLDQGQEGDKMLKAFIDYAGVCMQGTKGKNGFRLLEGPTERAKIVWYL